jgi:bifunctional oligoribonuclease and PAP phosphatase NrnA
MEKRMSTTTATPESIREIINAHRTFILTSHVNPDGDSLGSELAMARALRQLGKDAVILNHNPVPDNFTWLDPDGLIGTFDAARDTASILSAEVILVLDTNQPERLRSMEKAVMESRALKVIIDHHLEPHPFADAILTDTDATSTGEILYKILSSTPGVVIDLPMATALYTAIMTDTGSFRFPRTGSETHRIAADLISRGADPVECYVQVYERWTPGRMRLLGEVLDSMKTAHDGKCAWVVCTQAMFRGTGTSEVDTDNFTVYPMSIRGVVVGILFNELRDGVKISFRSKGDIAINELAKEFGGNGHRNAAGARLFNVTLDAVVPSVIEKVARFVNSSPSSHT